ncbi:hypothetical protein C2I19_17060 [Chromobacterium alticapitis]|uniref:Uncharacterized protein n=1 Tax=Chromobacterium alticapitis TaxID=2073169 RepID=A0A2S5DCH6_9NEIS|nr:hypothetical protein C2I19_17060 [Chromobacterium alticapitis]
MLHQILILELVHQECDTHSYQDCITGDLLEPVHYYPHQFLPVQTMLSYHHVQQHLQADLDMYFLKY